MLSFPKCAINFLIAKPVSKSVCSPIRANGLEFFNLDFKILMASAQDDGSNLDDFLI